MWVRAFAPDRGGVGKTHTHQEIDVFQHQHNPQRRQLTGGMAFTATAVLTTLALGLGVGPVAARQDAGPAVTRTVPAGDCLLERVDTQYVRCDDNTGNGVPAPAWIPER